MYACSPAIPFVITKLLPVTYDGTHPKPLSFYQQYLLAIQTISFFLITDFVFWEETSPRLIAAPFETAHTTWVPVMDCFEA